VELDAAIRSRRSVRRYKPDRVPRELIAEILELATWAPNHRMVEPWRFYVVTGAAREPLAAIHRDLVLAEHPREPGCAEQRYRELMQIPAFILVGYVTDATPKRDQENFAAACCAIQNLMLAANARGLGTVWRTGNVIRDERTRAWLNLPDDCKLAGLVQLGWPIGDSPGTSVRTPAAAKTIFMEG
jgi:nitroreductase